MFPTSLAGPGRFLVLLAIVFCLFLGAEPAVASSSPALFAGIEWRSFVSTRSGMIQVSVVCVIIGICILAKK